MRAQLEGRWLGCPWAPGLTASPSAFGCKRCQSQSGSRSLRLWDEGRKEAAGANQALEPAGEHMPQSRAASPSEAPG